MALVVFLKGINVGGHRTVRPSELAKRLAQLDAVSVGAAGTLIVRRPVRRAELHSRLQAELPFAATIIVRTGREVLELVARSPFVGRPVRRDLVHFVGIRASRRALPSDLPPQLPATGRWAVKVLAHDGPFVIGVHRREMRAIGLLAQLGSFLGEPMTVRSWSTVTQVARLLSHLAGVRRPLTGSSPDLGAS